MTTTSGLLPRIRKDGQPDQRGRHPNSVANLKPPWTTETQPPPNPGYSVTARLKHRLGLNEGASAKEVADMMIATALTPSSRGYSTALTQLLDRTEGKVPGDGVNINFNTIEVTIIEAAPPPGFQLSGKSG